MPKFYYQHLLDIVDMYFTLLATKPSSACGRYTVCPLECSLTLLIAVNMSDLLVWVDDVSWLWTPSRCPLRSLVVGRHFRACFYQIDTSPCSLTEIQKNLKHTLFPKLSEALIVVIF